MRCDARYPLQIRYLGAPSTEPLCGISSLFPFSPSALSPMRTPSSSAKSASPRRSTAPIQQRDAGSTTLLGSSTPPRTPPPPTSPPSTTSPSPATSHPSSPEIPTPPPSPPLRPQPSSRASICTTRTAWTRPPSSAMATSSAAPPKSPSSSQAPTVPEFPSGYFDLTGTLTVTDLSASAILEPSSFALLGTGRLSVVGALRRRLA